VKEISEAKKNLDDEIRLTISRTYKDGVNAGLDAAISILDCEACKRAIDKFREGFNSFEKGVKK
jgi:hypothetical protein